MRKVVTLISISLILIATLNAQGRGLFGKVTFPLRDVQVQSNSEGDWQAAAMNRELFVNDKIKTAAKSRLEITLNGGGKFRVAENTEVLLTKATIDGLKKDYGATVSKGQVWVAAKAAFGEKKNVQVRTPTAVAAIRGTKYRAVAGDQESSILVYDGEVAVNWANAPEQSQQGAQAGPPKEIQIGAPTEIAAPDTVAGPYEVSLEDWITLVEGMQINVRADGKYSMFEFDKASDAALEFVRWNQERDTQQGQ